MAARPLDPRARRERATGGRGEPVSALTCAHPGYEGPAAGWTRRSIEQGVGHLASNGGPIVRLHLDDETSSWQAPGDPLAVDVELTMAAVRAGIAREVDGRSASGQLR